MALSSVPRGAVVVTGASTGIGKACALHLDQLGFQVFAGVRKEADGKLLQKASARVAPVMLDVTDAASLSVATKTIAESIGAIGLAGLVNNAGIAVAGPLEFLPLDVVRRQLEVNVIGQLAVTQAFLPLLRQARGRIVMISSVSGRMASPFLGPYAASKFALEAMSDALRRELHPWGIKVAIVEPGATATPIWKKSLAAGEEIERSLPPEATELYRKAIDALRKGVANNVAGAGTPPEVVAQVVTHALTTRQPKIRYPVGREARIASKLLRILPDRLIDHFVARRFG
jgi:NAD(P)-dependent dehydrogenase (short-subunit alcohol dehydrogenase family)